MFRFVPAAFCCDKNISSRIVRGRNPHKRGIAPLTTREGKTSPLNHSSPRLVFSPILFYLGGVAQQDARGACGSAHPRASYAQQCQK